MSMLPEEMASQNDSVRADLFDQKQHELLCEDTLIAAVDSNQCFEHLQSAWKGEFVILNIHKNSINAKNEKLQEEFMFSMAEAILHFCDPSRLSRVFSSFFQRRESIAITGEYSDRILDVFILSKCTF